MTDPGRRIAIVGCGAIARAHAAAIAELPGIELSTVVDSDSAARARATEEFGVPALSSVEQLLEAGDIDAACVCTPPATHPELTEALLLGGVDVLCEKPAAVTSEAADRMREAAVRSGRRLSVSAKFRHVEDLAEAGRRIAGGEIGKPLSFAVTFCAPVDVRGRWPSNPELSGGGVLMDNGPHAFDVLSNVLDGAITHVAASLPAPVLVPPVEDTASLLFRTQDGASGRIELSWVYFSKDLDYLVAQGTEGTLRVGWTGGQLRRHGEREWLPFGSGYDKLAAFRGVWNAFLGSEAGGDCRHAITSLELIEDAYRASGTLFR